MKLQKEENLERINGKEEKWKKKEKKREEKKEKRIRIMLN